MNAIKLTVIKNILFILTLFWQKDEQNMHTISIEIPSK